MVEAMNNFSLSVCVPAFNEERTLALAVKDLINTLSSKVKELEIIIVDDGSIDSTYQLAAKLEEEYPRVKVLHHERNLGLGTSYRDALKEAKGDYFTWFPGDHENSAAQFIQYFPYLEKDTVVTSNHLGYDQRSFFRHLISRSYTWIFNFCFHLNLKYYNGLSIFPTAVLRSFPIVSEGFSLPAESMIKAVRKGCRVVELTVPLSKRNWGKSKALTLSSLGRMLKDSFIILLSKK